MGSDSGVLAPAGTELVLSNVWWDGANQLRSGSSLTQASGSTATLNGTTTFNGTVAFNGSATVGPTASGDLTSAVTPSSAGLLAWDFPYVFGNSGSGSTGSAAVTGGTLYIAKIPLVGGTVVTNLWFRIATAASGITTGQCFGGLYSSGGVLLAGSADLSTVIGTNTGPIQAALTATYTVPSGGGVYYAGFFFNASVTEPVLGCFVNANTVTSGAQTMGSLTTFGNTAAKFPFAVNTTGNTTALPTPLTMSSNSATGAYAFWVGVN